MELKKYLLQERGRQSELARAIGAHAPDISRWADGSRPVPFHYAPKIELATNGAVSRQDLFPDSWGELWPELREKPM